jgi:hypothetical protein
MTQVLTPAQIATGARIAFDIMERVTRLREVIRPNVPEGASADDIKTIESSANEAINAFAIGCHLDEIADLFQSISGAAPEALGDALRNRPLNVALLMVEDIVSNHSAETVKYFANDIEGALTRIGTALVAIGEQAKPQAKAKRKRKG